MRQLITSQPLSNITDRCPRAYQGVIVRRVGTAGAHVMHFACVRACGCGCLQCRRAREVGFIYGELVVDRFFACVCVYAKARVVR